MADPDQWAAPAMLRVDIPTRQAGVAADIIYAWLANPGLTEKANQDRLEIMNTIEAWRWRSAEHFGVIRKKQIPDEVIAIKTDKMKRRMEKMLRSVGKHISAADTFLIPLLITGVRTDENWNTVRINPATVMGVATRMASGRAGDIKQNADNIRNRLWYQTRPILHVSHAMRNLLIESGADLQSLLAKPTWTGHLLERAEKVRRLMLPILQTPVDTESTIQFRPL